MTPVATISKDHNNHSCPSIFCHTTPYQQQQQQQHHLAIFLSPATTDASHIPGAWVDPNVHCCHCQTTAATAASDHQEDMNALRQTIASLRDQAKKLEMTDLMVKKSIQVVAKKRRLAQHSSQWDWCDPLDDEEEEEEDDDDGIDMDSFHSFQSDTIQDTNVPVLDDASETDHSMHDVQAQDCDGDWEWVD
jgi:hypothetical protein